MSPLEVFVWAILIITLAGAFVAPWRGKGSLRKLPLVVFALLLVAVNLLFVLGGAAAIPAETARRASVVAAVLAYPFLPLTVLALLGSPWSRDLRVWVMLVGSGVLVAHISANGGLSVGDLFETFPANYYLATCLGFATAVSASAFLRTSLLRREGRMALIASMAMIAAGPIYAFELKALGYADVLDAHLGAPIAVWALLYALVLGNPMIVPLPPVVRGVERRKYTLPSGRVALWLERRPKYSRAAVLEHYHYGRHTLVITSDSSGHWTRDFAGIPRVAVGPGEGEIQPSRLAAIANTAADFLHRSSEGAVLLDGLDYLFTHNPREGVLEFLGRLHAVAARTGGAIVAPLCRLTEEEREVLLSMPLPVSELPDVTDEVETILHETVGGAGRHILREYCAHQQIRKGDISVGDLPRIADSVDRFLKDFAEGTVEESLRSGWEAEADVLKARLLAFHRARLVDMEAAPWRREASDEESEDGLIAEVRDVFARHMGDVGTRLFETQLKLVATPRGLRRKDLTKLAKSTESAFAVMKNAIDVETARSDLESRARRIRSEIMRMAGVSA